MLLMNLKSHYRVFHRIIFCFPQHAHTFTVQFLTWQSLKIDQYQARFFCNPVLPTEQNHPIVILGQQITILFSLLLLFLEITVLLHKPVIARVHLSSLFP